MKKVMLFGIIIMIFFYMLVVIVGYVVFGDVVLGNLFIGFSILYWFVDFVNICIVIYFIGVY